MSKFINDFLENPLNKFFLWFLTFILLFLIGISNVFADTLSKPDTFNAYNSYSDSWDQLNVIDNNFNGYSVYTTQTDNAGGQYSKFEIGWRPSNNPVPCKTKYSFNGVLIDSNADGSSEDVFNFVSSLKWYSKDGQNSNNCSYTVSSDHKTLSFACSNVEPATSSQYWIFSLYLVYFQAGVSPTRIGLYTNMEYTCTLDTGGIIENQTNNTNKILNSQKNIFDKIKDILSFVNPSSGNFFGTKLVQLIVDGLKSLFIPSNDFFTTWWDDFKTYIDAKLGLLLQPFDLFVSFVNAYLNLSESDIVINIPEITVPNFEDHVIIEEQSFNWKALLQSKPAFQTLWNLYLDFVDVFLIINFFGLCETVYGRIFGGDTTANLDGYTVSEDSYWYDPSNGEVLTNVKHKERVVKPRKKEKEGKK